MPSLGREIPAKSATVLTGTLPVLLPLVAPLPLEAPSLERRRAGAPLGRAPCWVVEESEREGEGEGEGGVSTCEQKECQDRDGGGEEEWGEEVTGENAPIPRSASPRTGGSL